jgi:hypothetical protein
VVVDAEKREKRKNTKEKNSFKRKERSVFKKSLTGVDIVRDGMIVVADTSPIKLPGSD